MPVPPFETAASRPPRGEVVVWACLQRSSLGKAYFIILSRAGAWAHSPFAVRARSTAGVPRMKGLGPRGAWCSLLAVAPVCRLPTRAGPWRQAGCASLDLSDIQNGPHAGAQIGESIGLADQVHAGIEPAVVDDGVARVAGGEQHLEAGRRFTASSANWRPFMPPGITTSVNSRSMSGSRSSTSSAALPLAA